MPHGAIIVMQHEKKDLFLVACYESNKQHGLDPSEVSWYCKNKKTTKATDYPKAIPHPRLQRKVKPIILHLWGGLSWLIVKPMTTLVIP